MNIEKMIEEFYAEGTFEDILEEDINPEKVRRLFEAYIQGGEIALKAFYKNKDYEFEHVCLAHSIITDNQ
jgi:hypothetical protein